MRRLLVPVSAVLLLWLGCATHAFARPVTDSAGRVVEVPDRVVRVFAAGPPASTLLYVVAPDKMIGWVRAPRTEEKPFLLPATRHLPELGRLTGRGNTLSLERLLAEKPDLIIDFGTLNDTYRSLADRVQAQTGIPYLLIDGRFANTPAALRLLGRVLGVEARGEALAQEAERIFAAVDATLANIPSAERPKVYLARGPDGFESGTRGSINTEMIERVGAINPVEGLRESGGLVRVGAERLLVFAPDAIVTLDAALRDSLATRPPWSELAAVKAGRIFVAPALPFGFIDSPPSANRLIGLSWLMHKLYPGKVAGDLRAEVAAFYRLFYQVEIDGAALDRLLGGTP
ncbi:iron ABC transporter substrate-binding protein [Bosea sp. (in: a-proteobacteria)]|uniref:iron ABC transporter substrate-binding protein n=1 Tax=Bosea sp. (in: a-proteobacteria) TaxID=1871050 RepID=UPI00260D0357|nr:iron ABC transporter substrate-binding protein [Bosea sp. (in: a-proteobacteria)]MCO5089762.1 iron ABC transporter substrate-binding protein [Bosea sp. (in: a-proteobacteria)]